MKNVIQVTTTVKLSLKTLFTHFDSIFLTIFEEEYNFGLAKHESSFRKVCIKICYDDLYAWAFRTNISKTNCSICWTVKKQLYFLLLKLFLTRGNMTDGWITFYFQSRILLFLSPAVHVIFYLLAPFLLRCFLFLFTGIPKAIKGGNTGNR